MAAAIRMIHHEQRLSLVDHLEELRFRLIVSAAVLAVAFGICFWQNQALLGFINAPLTQQTQQQVREGNGPYGQTWRAQKAVLAVSKDTQAIVGRLSAKGSGLSASTRAALAAEIPRLKADVARLPRSPQGYLPTTLGIGEPFTTTISVAMYFALLVALPVILFELYGFVLPAFTPSERRIAVPMLTAVPFLFVTGAAFGYYVVLPAAVHFLQGFNSSQFNVIVQASSYYKFAVTIMIALGLVFQVPIAIVGATQAGIVTPRQLRKGRRYALLACAAIAALLPGDVVTLILETVPLYVLYELSIVLAALLERRAARREREQAAAAGGGGEGALALAGGGDFGQPSAQGEREDVEDAVRRMIDHTDPELGG